MTVSSEVAKRIISLPAMADPVAFRWPGDTAAGLLDDVVWTLSGENGAVVDDLVIEKLKVLADALRPLALVIYATPEDAP